MSQGSNNLTRPTPTIYILRWQISQKVFKKEKLSSSRIHCCCIIIQFSSVQSLSRVWVLATPWIAAHQASLSITNSRRLTSMESVMPSSHLILCHPLLLLPPIPPSIRVFSNESTLRMRWPKYWNFSFSIISSKEIPGVISMVRRAETKRKKPWSLGKGGLKHNKLKKNNKKAQKYWRNKLETHKPK